MDEARRIMGESAQTHHTLKLPMKHVLCRANSLAGELTKTRAMENVQGIKYVTISLNKEVLVSTDLRHSLIIEEIRKLEKGSGDLALLWLNLHSEDKILDFWFFDYRNFVSTHVKRSSWKFKLTMSMSLHYDDTTPHWISLLVAPCLNFECFSLRFPEPALLLD